MKFDNTCSIVFDLDDTICYPNHDGPTTYDKYVLARPNTELIEAMQILSARGVYIIIHSARRMLTHRGDIKKIKEDVGEISEQWLKDHGVPYNELVFGKPYANTFYVDDKAMSIRDFFGTMVDNNII